MKKEKLIFKDYVDKLTPKEKKVLFKMLADNGLSHIRAHRRLSFIGFKPWEYEGIYNILKKEGINIPAKRKTFWEKLANKEKFYFYMNQIGMSRYTVYTRFSTFSFASWEKIGIKEIIQKFNNIRNTI